MDSRFVKLLLLAITVGLFAGVALLANIKNELSILIRRTVNIELAVENIREEVSSVSLAVDNIESGVSSIESDVSSIELEVGIIQIYQQRR